MQPAGLINGVGSAVFDNRLEADQRTIKTSAMNFKFERFRRAARR
jgi:hypothetical protein